MHVAPLLSPAAGLDGAGGWRARRAAILRAWEAELCGPAPPVRAKVRTQVLLPVGHRGAPPPVLLLQSSHLWWAQRAVDRGIAACVVHAADGDDDTRPLGGPALRRRADALSAALDALHGREDVDAARVAVAGHSRNGKAALLAAAFDERFAACLLSSAGVLGAIPARLAADRHFGEGLELLTRVHPDWYLPALGDRAGREAALPADAHDLMACVAPRPLLVSVGERDPVESTWAAQAAADAAGDVWARLGVPGGLSLAWRAGGHDLDGAAVDEHLDRVAAVLGAPGGRRARVPERLHPEALVPWTAWEARKPPDLLAAVRAVVGPAAERAWDAPRAPGPARPGAAAAPPGVRAVRTATAGGVEVDISLRTTGRGLRPLVVWLGPLCRPTGYVPAYDRGDPPHVVLAKAGLAVACHHPAGTATRLREAGGLARLVEDAAAVAAAARAVPEVDPARVWLAGYGTGALVAAHLALLAPAAGAALVLPSTDEPLVPPGVAPAYGLGDLLAALAARRVVVVAAEHDPVADVAAIAGRAGVRTRVREPFHRLSMRTRRDVGEWLAARAAT